MVLTNSCVRVVMPKLTCVHTADCKLAKPLAMLTRLLRNQKKRIKRPFHFLGYVLVNVRKHVKSDSLIIKAFQTKAFFGNVQ